jgi:hypothetical protein
MIISHGSGSGFALDVIKAGNGEAIRVTKTSGSGNAITVVGANIEVLGNFVKTGGTSSQFLKADGSVDSNSYVTLNTTQTITGAKTFTASGNYTTFTNNDFFQVEFSNGSSKLNLGSSSNIGHIASNGDLRFNTNYPTDALNSPKLTIASNGQATFSVDAVINGVNVGRGGSSVSTNTRVGTNALTNNTTGSSNTGVGLLALGNNSTGSRNTSLGEGALVNNTDGAVIMESNASENNNWLWKENSKAWGLFWFNRGTQSGQTIGGYSTVGAELMFMGGNTGVAMPSGWTGYQSGSYIAAMISNYNGYIYSASTIYAATSMVVGGNTVYHAGNIPTWNQNTTGNAATVTNGVYTTGDQTIGGTKTFSSTIAGSINGNAATVGGFAAAQTYTSTGNAAGSFLGGHYSSGGAEKPNSGTFGGGKFKVAMLSGGNLGFGGSWNDVMWVSSYNGGDVKSSHALVFDKYSANVWVSDQDFDSGSWGTGHLLLHSSNYTSFAPSLTGAGASGTWGINITGNAATLGNISASGFWQAGGGWAADLTSNGYVRQIGLAYVGGEFAILTNNAQISTLIDGTYFAGEQGGFYSMNSSNQFSSRVGFNRDGSGNASFNASIVPTTNGTLNLGSSSARWNTIFTSDLSMSNGIGDYTIVEGEEDLFIYNNKTNKVFKFLLQEVDPSIAPAKKVH